MNLSPLISVIIPMFNAEKSIQRCLSSVCCQSYTNLEIIIVDDGSLDTSAAIVDALAQYDLRIKYFFKSNGGVSSARNMGIEKATGEYLAFVDADDSIEVNMYEDMLRLLLETGADIVMCGRTRVVEGKEYHFKNTGIQHFYNGEIDMRNLSNQFDLNILTNKLYKIDLFHEIKLPENMSYAEDLFIMPDVLNQAKHIVYTSKGYYHYFENLESASFCLNEEKLQSDIIAKKKLLSYMRDKNQNMTIAFDWLFGSYVRGYQMAVNREKFKKEYRSFFLSNFNICCRKIKCLLFFISPFLYFKLKNEDIN